MVTTSEEKVMKKKSDVVYYSFSRSLWYFLEQIIKAMLRCLGFISKTALPDQSKLSPDQKLGQSTHSTEEMATIFVSRSSTTRSVASKRVMMTRKPPRGSVTSGRGPKTNKYSA